MNSCIQILDEKTINQIAAGEVIEDPSSVVKELIDNALDAKATKIVVEISAGGFFLIRISDNGRGMSKDDAVLCLERHATSKIRKIHDLLKVKSMGFRGEALASIASISKMTLITALENENHVATRVVCEGGKVLTVGPFSREKGTTIEIRSLFYNVPARKKFQKSPGSSQADIYKMLCRLALARPDVSFVLKANEEEIFCYIPEMGKDFLPLLKGSVAKTLGKEVESHILPLELDDPYLKISGFIGSPLLSRQNKTLQHLFINQRVVESQAISFAVLDGYSTMLATKRYPVFVLHVEMDPELLDVNVHPQKKQVRFKEESRVKEVVRGAVFKALQGKPKTLSFAKTPYFEKPEVFEFPIEREVSKTLWSQSVLEVKREDVLPFQQPLLPQLQDFTVIGFFKSSLLLDAKTTQNKIQIPGEKGPFDGIFFVDLKSAKRRLFFDKALEAKKEKESLQQLLFPVQISLKKEEVQSLEKNKELFALCGIELRAFGESKILVEACISELNEEKILEIVKESLADLEGFKKEGFLEVQKKILLKVCKHLKTKEAFFTKESALTILSSLLKAKQPYFCPFGKKTIAHISQDSYEKLFEK